MSRLQFIRIRARFFSLLALAPGFIGCSEWSDPAQFETERAALQSEWESACSDSCDGADMPAACGIVGTPKDCAGYNQAHARACIDLYEKVVRREICSATDRHMVNLGEICNAVYVECGGAAETGDESDAGGDE